MRKVIGIMAVVLALGFTVSMAQPGEGWDGEHHRMPHGMMHAQILPSSDGGVIVLRGGTLYKYDKDLNLKKQVELPRPEGWGRFKDGDSGMMEHRHWHHSTDSTASKPGK